MSAQILEVSPLGVGTVLDRDAWSTSTDDGEQQMSMPPHTTTAMHDNEYISPPPSPGGSLTEGGTSARMSLHAHRQVCNTRRATVPLADVGVTLVLDAFGKVVVDDDCPHGCVPRQRQRPARACADGHRSIRLGT